MPPRPPAPPTPEIALGVGSYLVDVQRLQKLESLADLVVRHRDRSFPVHRLLVMAGLPAMLELLSTGDMRLPPLPLSSKPGSEATAPSAAGGEPDWRSVVGLVTDRNGSVSELHFEQSLHPDVATIFVEFIYCNASRMSTLAQEQTQLIKDLIAVGRALRLEQLAKLGNKYAARSCQWVIRDHLYLFLSFSLSLCLSFS